jgi:class 3 adenylate cyclase
MADRPRGTVTFLFTDIESSRALWERNSSIIDPVQRHIALLDVAIHTHGGVHFTTVGDAVQGASPNGSSSRRRDRGRALRPPGR